MTKGQDSNKKERNSDMSQFAQLLEQGKLDGEEGQFSISLQISA